MNQAIHYVHQDHINQNGTAISTSIPAQAVNISVSKVLNKATLLTQLAHACDFPSYFSPNWDSAWDCLTDSDIEYLTLDLTATYDINNEDFKVFKSLIEDAFRDFGKPQLWIIMASDDSLSHP